MNEASINLIIKYESLHDGDLTDIGLSPKMDPIGIWTEGYGRAMIDVRNKQFLKFERNRKYANEHRTIRSVEGALLALTNDLEKYSQIAEMALGKTWNELNDNQKGALTSFCYNCGTGNPPYKIWTNIRQYRDGKLRKEVLIAYWKSSVIKAGGVVLNGLVRRRDEEVKLFFS
jgi:lysozyme